jgi:hypothetical protein
MLESNLVVAMAVILEVRNTILCREVTFKGCTMKISPGMNAKWESFALVGHGGSCL